MSSAIIPDWPVKTTLQTIIKNNIKELLRIKKVKIARLSEELGYSRGFFNSILNRPNKFFNLEHIEKICKALNYPAYLLLVEGEDLGLLTDDEQHLVIDFRILTNYHQQRILGNVEAFREDDEEISKKKYAGNG